MKKLTYIICVVGFIFSCNDTTDDNINTLIPNGEIPDEVLGVALIFPFESSLCSEGTEVSPTESTVLFEWVPNNNAQSYTLTIEDLSLGTVSEFQTEDFLFPARIQRAHEFRWFVSYTYQNEIYQSEIWNFYNEGEAIQTYPPFQTEIISPTMAQNIANTSTITLQWNGSDVDDDIIGYDVYFGTDNPPSTPVANDISTTTLNVSVSAGTIYYWNVITKDAAGNTSESGTFQFKVLD